MIKTPPISTDNAERLLSGKPTDGGLDDLALLIGALRTAESPRVDRALVDRIATEAAAIAHRGQNRPAITAPAAKVGLRLRHRLATVAAATTLVLGSGAGVAIAADGAAPGDALYGLDKALERVAIGDGGAAERLQEAADLVRAGQLARGLEHAAEVVAASHDGESGGVSVAASGALRAAAERISASVSANDGTGNQQVQTAAADVLTYLADNVGDIDGRKVAELSQLIGAAARGEIEAPSTTPSRPNPPGKPVPGPSANRAGERP
ncbi:MAG: hypothetical protein IH850_00330 [Acidobacteria bacterium]|nr:hypothetical protein [Acidobacteriota bacterium]